MGNWFKDEEKARRERDDDHPRAVEGVQLSDKTLQGKCKGLKGFSITYHTSLADLASSNGPSQASAVITGKSQVNESRKESMATTCQ